MIDVLEVKDPDKTTGAITRDTADFINVLCRQANDVTPDNETIRFCECKNDVDVNIFIHQQDGGEVVKYELISLSKHKDTRSEIDRCISLLQKIIKKETAEDLISTVSSN